VLHKRAKPLLPPCVYFSNHKLIITLYSRTVFIPCCSWTGWITLHRKVQMLSFTRVTFATQASPRTKRHRGECVTLLMSPVQHLQLGRPRGPNESLETGSGFEPGTLSTVEHTLTSTTVRTGNPQYSGTHSNQYDGFVVRLEQENKHIYIEFWKS